jgi:OOP family OmpA-OmpF porin
VEKNMKLARASGTLGLAALAAIASPFAVAADSGWYGGISIGQSRARIADDRIRSQLLGSGLTMTSINDDNRDTGYKLFGGYKFDKNFAVEGGYFNLGKFGFTANTTPAGALTGTGKFQGLNLDAVGILPFTEKFSGFARAGLIYTQAKDTFTGTGGAASIAANNPNPKKSEGNFKFGFGVQYDFTPALGLRGEWERYRINDAVGNKGDIDMLLVGLVYTFGAGEPAPRAAPPPYVAPVAAAPEPVLVVVPVARTQQYCGILDIQFEINRDVIQREEQEKLAVLETFLKKYPDTTVVIEGHTDEVGTDADNMKLSQRRADSVVNYLASRGIARSRMKAVGYGERRPIADNRTEIGKRLNRRINAIVACATDIEGLTPIPARITMALEMEFDTNQADVRPQYREELRKVANFLKANPGVTATVEGHTSNQTGSRAQAMQLSQRRAESVVNYLATQFGVDRTRLSVEGFGGTRRFAYNTSAEGQQENRRVNIIFDFPK